MSCHLRMDQTCAEDCIKPARFGDLCTAHYMAASPAVRAVCDLLDQIDARVAGYEREQKQITALQAIWDIDKPLSADVGLAA